MWKTLFIVKLPPPVNGATMMNKILRDSYQLNKKYSIRWIDNGLARAADDFGVVSVGKIYRWMITVLIAAYEIIICQRRIVYITIAPRGVAFAKDSIFLLLSRMTAKRTFVHFHGRGLKEYSSSNSVARWYMKLVLKKCVPITLSQSLSKDISEVCLRRPVVVPNCTNETIDSGCIYYSIENNPLKLVYLSNFHPDKGVGTFIRVIKLLKEKLSVRGFECSIIGNGTKYLTIDDAVDMVKRADVDDCIKHLGPLYGKEKMQTLAESDILVFPTSYRNEAFPIVLLEAMEAGMAIISSPIGGIVDIVRDGETGYLLSWDNEEGICQAIVNLDMDRKKLNEMKKTARSTYELRYTKKRFINSIDGVLSNELSYLLNP